MIRSPARSSWTVWLVSALVAACSNRSGVSAPAEWQRLTECRFPAGDLAISGPLTGGPSGAGELCTELELRAISAHLESEATATRTAEDQHRAGIAALYLGDARRAERWLRTAAESAPADDQVRADLGAAELLIAREEGSPDFLVRAVEDSALALERAPRTRSADVNRRLALRLLGADEAVGPTRERRLAELDDLVDDPWSASAKDRDLLVEVIERRWLVRWAERILAGDGRGAAQWSARVREGVTVVSESGDPWGLAAAAAAIFEKAGQANRDAQVARAWLDYVLALSEFEAGHASAADRLLSRTEAVLRPLSPAVHARAALLRSAVDRVQGRIERALRAVRPDQPRFTGFRVLEARRRWQRGLLLSEVGRLAEASSEYLTAQAMFSEAGDREGEAVVSSLLASWYAELHDWPVAWQHMVRANRLLADCRRIRAESVRTTASLVASSMGLSRAASLLRRPAIDEAVAAGDQLGAAFLLADEASDRSRSGRRAEALQLLDDARALADRSGDGGSRAMFEPLHALTRAMLVRAVDPAGAASLYQQAIALYRRRGSEFNTVDALLALGQVLRNLGRHGDAESALREGLAMSRRQSSALDRSRAADLREARWDLLRALAGLYLDLGRADDAYSLIEGARAEDLGDRGRSRAVPRDGGQTLWISYLELDDRIQAWVTSPEGRRAYSFASQGIADAAAGLREALRAGADPSPQGAHLFQLLLGPVRQQLEGVRDLVVCVDGVLTGIPFAALWDSSSGRLVGDRASTTYARSCRPQAAAVSPPTSSPRRVLIAGDAVRSGFRDRWPRLPGARDEILAVAGLYAGDEAEVLRDRTLVREALLKRLPQASVFHFAGHAISHPSRSRLSRLVMSTASSSDEGMVYGAEIAALELKAELVVLAACETAAGEPRAGAGVHGLARAFLSSGAATVIATLWPVPDGASSAFFVELHRRLRLGRAPADAVRETQAWARASGMSAEVWAPVVTIGAPSVS